jgi:hypothetical protein
VLTSSSKHFDWKNIEIYIQNEENKIQEKATPSENGFYLIPVNQKKDYKLMIRSTKKNLQFEPAEHPIVMKGLSDDEIEKKYNSMSFNFKLSGFSLSQRVKFSGEEEDKPFMSEEKSGITILLSQNGKQIGQTKTNQQGEFTFSKVTEGEFEISVLEANRKKLNFLSHTFTCLYSWEKGSSCTGDIIISGTTLTRGIRFSGESFRKGTLLLKSANGKALGCKADLKAQGIRQGQAEGFECSSPIVNNSVSFEQMPFGNYIVKLYFDNVHILVEPAELKITHPAKNEKEGTLEFNGFSQGQTGRVLTAGGKGIANVEIKIDGEKKGVTNQNGDFSLDKMNLGSYDFEAIHKHYVFKPFVLKIDGESERVLNKVTADLMLLCGKVDYLQAGNDVAKGYQVNVQIENQEVREKRATKAKEDGSYCFEVPAGQYIVKASINYYDKVLSVVPKQRQISLENEPALNVDFTREKLSIKGALEYLPNTPKEVKEKTKVFLINSNNQVIKTQDLEGQTGFQFDDLFEEGYSVKVENSQICFEKDVVNTDEYSGVARFVQKGIIVPYKTDIHFHAQVNGKETITFSPKAREICFSHTEMVRITVDDMFTFKNNMNNFEFNPINFGKGLVFEVERFKLKGKLVFEPSSSSKFNAILKNLAQQENLRILSKGTNGDEQEIQVKSAGENVFEYSFHSKLNSDLTVIPKFLVNELGERLLISPKQNRFSVGSLNEKVEPLKDFHISIGSLVRGKFSKPIKNVKITVERKSKEDESFRQYQNAVVEGGAFQLGPFDSNYLYNVVLSKKGFDFKIEINRNENNDLDAEISILEISQVKIKIFNEKNKPLRGVSVYITSTDRGTFMKLNAVTNQKGLVTKKIHKGQYFIKAVLKEYELDPAQTVLKIDEGEKKELTFRAKKTQFSVFGTGRSSE